MVFPRSLLWVVTALLFFAPALNLVWRGGSGYCFFALLALALFSTTRRPVLRGHLAALQRYRWYTLGMLALPLAAVVQQPLLGYWMPHQFDATSRFALALPIFLMLRQLPSRNLRAIGWGCAAGAIAVGCWALLMRLHGGWTDETRLDNPYTNAIPFGDTALLLAFLSAFTLGWDKPRDWLTLVAKGFALVCGSYASFLSGTRGGWIAIPVFVVLLGMQYRWFTSRKRILISVAAIVVIVGAVLSTERVMHRIRDISQDYALMDQGQDHTSVGIRIQLWQASYKLFIDHPVYGVGKGKLDSALATLAQRGVASAGIVNEHSHSDFFSTIAEQGFIGGVCLLLFYMGLTIHFWRSRRATDPVVRTAAYSGMAVAFSTILFGLTIDVLAPNMVAVLIALLSASLLAMIDARQCELSSDACGRSTLRTTATASRATSVSLTAGRSKQA